MAAPQIFLVIDVESIGLHGEGFAVAGGIFRVGGGVLAEEFLFACPPDLCAGNEDDREWVCQNVQVPPPTHADPVSLRTAFWGKWLEAKTRGAEMAAECLWPVEAGFLSRCIADDPAARAWQGPYPLHEIASILLADGMDPKENYERTPEELPAHCPLADARHSARLLGLALCGRDPGSVE